MMTFLSDPDPGYEMYGFDRAEFEYFLLCQGKTIDGVELVSVAQPVPEWARELTGIPKFTINEAAALICGLDPFDRGWGSDDESRKLDIALRLLNAALDRGDLSRVGQDEGGNPLLNADDLRCWCPTVDRDWPIPPSPDIAGKVNGMATDAELLAKLRESEKRAVAAESQLKAADELTDTTRKLREQIAGLQQAVAKLEAEKGQAENHANTLEAEIAKGKGKSSMLRLIGGLAMAGHGMDIHATRLNGISVMLSDLANKGVNFSEPTIRDLLKDAAKLIEPRTEPNQK